MTHANRVRYGRSQKEARLFVSGTELARDMSCVVRGARSSKTIAFPSTVRKVLDGAFLYTSVRSVVLNEGLETLGKYLGLRRAGVFSFTRLKQVALPTTVRALGNAVFYGCGRLERVAFRGESGLEKIGDSAFEGCGSLRRVAPRKESRLRKVCDNCFSGSGLEEFVVPAELKEMGDNVFRGCGNLRRVVLGEGMKALEGYWNGALAQSGVEEIVLRARLSR